MRRLSVTAVVLGFCVGPGAGRPCACDRCSGPGGRACHYQWARCVLGRRRRRLGSGAIHPCSADRDLSLAELGLGKLRPPDAGTLFSERRKPAGLWPARSSAAAQSSSAAAGRDLPPRMGCAIHAPGSGDRISAVRSARRYLRRAGTAPADPAQSADIHKSISRAPSCRRRFSSQF